LGCLGQRSRKRYNFNLRTNYAYRKEDEET
jgi:hypothetical protein